MDAPTPLWQADIDTLFDDIQLRTFRYFWNGADQETGLPYDKRLTSGAKATDAVSISALGFGIQAIIVATHREWIIRDQALDRLVLILDNLDRTERFHGAFAHFIHGSTAKVIHFSDLDDGGDLVETTFLMQGLICARHYFSGGTEIETKLRQRITALFDTVEWNWFTRGEHGPLFWHWSPRHDWAMNLPIRGWNEALSAYVLAAGSTTHPIGPESYHHGWAKSPSMENGKTYLGTTLPLGEPFGGPLFLSQYSFCGLDPRHLRDRYADYWEEAVAHARINHDYCMTVPAYEQGGFWGLTASEAPHGYAANSPTVDSGAIAPTAALGSFPFLPEEAEKTLRAFVHYRDGALLHDYGFSDAFAPSTGWIAETHLGIDQGPIVAMIENHRSGLLWRLFMAAPEVQRGLDRLGFDWQAPEA